MKRLLFLIGFLWSATSYAALVVETGAVYDFDEYENKDFVINAIMKFDSNFSVLQVNGSFEIGGVHQEAMRLLPYYSFWGLNAVKCVDATRLDGSRETEEILFLYNSDISRNPTEATPEYDRNGRIVKRKGYVPCEVFISGLPNVVFAKKVSKPDVSRFTSTRKFSSKEGAGHSCSYNKFFKEKGIDKDAFLSTFSNTVHKICDSGVFAIKPKQKKETVSNVIGEIISLSPREISEVVYWLWLRDGKEGKYPELSRRNPELFEPIGDISEFKTEIGHMLVARSKK